MLMLQLVSTNAGHLLVVVRAASAVREGMGVFAIDLDEDRRPATTSGVVATGHVWTAPAVQEESEVSAKRSGAAMYPACSCSRYGCWP